MFGEMKYYYQFIEGAILGSVVGDALGVPGEFMTREELRENPITDMIGGGAHDQLPGTWSDDTSMTLCTIDSIIENGIDYDDQMYRFADWLWSASNTARDEVFDVGGATKHAIFRYMKKTPALECGELAENTCGNGSLMRIMPTALYLIGQYGCRDLDDRAAEIIHNTSKCTHAHLRCQMACGVFCSVVFSMSCCGDLHNAVVGGVASALKYYGQKPEFTSVYDDFTNLIGIEKWDEDEIQSTGYVLHTLQAALWCLPNYAFPEAGIILRAVLYRKEDDPSVPEPATKKFEKMVYEYSRSAASAISEFAPNNSFYAGGRKLTVDQVDLTTAQS